MLSDRQVEELVELLASLDESTKIYFGCDSIRMRRRGAWCARYAAVVMVHMNGKNGCKIFSDISWELDYDLKPDRPKLRMINETRKVCELYNQLIPLIDGYEIQIHLDISEDPRWGSNVAAQEAAGYVLGATGIDEENVKLKPHAFAASFGADKAASLVTGF